jgi:hypothetical protein
MIIWHWGQRAPMIFFSFITAMKKGETSPALAQYVVNMGSVRSKQTALSSGKTVIRLITSGMAS